MFAFLLRAWEYGTVTTERLTLAINNAVARGLLTQDEADIILNTERVGNQSL